MPRHLHRSSLSPAFTVRISAAASHAAIGHLVRSGQRNPPDSTGPENCSHAREQHFPDDSGHRHGPGPVPRPYLHLSGATGFRIESRGGLNDHQDRYRRYRHRPGTALRGSGHRSCGRGTRAAREDIRRTERDVGHRRQQGRLLPRGPTPERDADQPGAVPEQHGLRAGRRRHRQDPHRIPRRLRGGPGREVHHSGQRGRDPEQPASASRPGSPR